MDYEKSVVKTLKQTVWQGSALKQELVSIEDW
jgi:hypothetical protein